MMGMASQIVVLVFGVVICLVSVWGIFVPQKLMKWVTETMDKNWGLYLAVIVRVVLGSALILAAPGSLYPLVFLVLGWIAIAAAAAIALMGKERLHKLVNWCLERFSATAIRLWLLFGIAFGGMLIYGIS